ncbi:formamidopyrimidine-DNA glycosylase [Geomonas sp. Red32]|uniref:DNA-formamidopyrimidine glycosylase family protein n=1 Tax=Geomonas sp. Red32 TaxID=2912856 RepID=UPI00202CE023|nr:DNA-formamidopyrimidine glycosylase family protein [Geomonas sp. Red32]MCM0082842.1 formamidopyrimidine-DNA glycosylase [Geomonas sp. Red32]
MPELPDLTVFAANLAKAVTGKAIAAVEFRGKRLNAAPGELSRSLVSRRVAAVERAGKEISFRMDNGAALFVHLMLKGVFQFSDSEHVLQLPSLILALCFSDDTALAVTDPKRLAAVNLNPRVDERVPDALAVTREYLENVFRQRPRVPVKTLLIDQKVVKGIGNAYSDEILWKARISPKSLAGKVPSEGVDALVEAIPAVLRHAIDELKRRTPDAISGEMRDFLNVHVSGRKLSPTGHPIIKEEINSKITYYTEEQRLYR